jgi:hypothetical protein
VHSKTRVRYPMVRKGFLASPDKPQGVRGQDEFVTMLGIDQIQRLLPAHPHKFILTADPLGLVRRGNPRKLRTGLYFCRLLRLAF